MNVNGRTAEHPIDPLFLERWSPRAFTSEPIPHETLLTMLEAARWAASSFNAQPWRFVYALRDTPHWDSLLSLLIPFNQDGAKQASALIFAVSKTTSQSPKTGEEYPLPTHSFDTGAAPHWPTNAHYLRYQFGPASDDCFPVGGLANGLEAAVLAAGIPGVGTERLREVRWVFNNPAAMATSLTERSLSSRSSCTFRKRNVRCKRKGADPVRAEKERAKWKTLELHKRASVRRESSLRMWARKKRPWDSASSNSKLRIDVACLAEAQIKNRLRSDRAETCQALLCDRIVKLAKITNQRYVMQIVPKRALATILVFFCWLPGSSAQQTELQSDRAQRDFAIRWPPAYDPSVAPVFSHNQLLIHANCHHAFARLADAADWPNWFVLVKGVTNETPGNTGQGALYRLKIFNSPIQSRIVDFVLDERISWIPFGADETESRHGHYHAWRFAPKTSNCLGITEETGIGPGDIKDPINGSHLMHKAHELWLDSLKYTSEP